MKKNQTSPNLIDRFISRLSQLSESLPDKRTGSNLQYQMADIVKAAFAVFFTQSPSFLAGQKIMKTSKGKSNGETIFQMEKVPCDEHIRQMLDPVSPGCFYDEFHTIMDEVEAQGKLEAYRVLEGKHVLVSLDGTQYFSSYEIECENCQHRKRRNGKVQNYHTAILPVLVAPENPHVLALPPEFIMPQDGQDKQDCERAASKRWVEQQAEHYAPRNAILLGDDLYANQPLCQIILDHQLHFLFVCKPDSHQALYQALEQRPVDTTLTERHWNGKHGERWVYRLVNEVPLRADEEALSVNWLELHITHADTGVSLYHNSWVTDLTVTRNKVVELADCGRARWKVENEGNNVLKTKGYHLEHNFGHANQYLALTLLTLNLLAFLLHTVSDLADTTYQLIRKKLGRRDTFFNDLRALMRYMLFDSWEHLLNFMFVQLELDPLADP